MRLAGDTYQGRRPEFEDGFQQGVSPFMLVRERRFFLVDVITTLDDDSVMKLDYTVPSIYLASLRNGLPIVATSPAFPGRHFEGDCSCVPAPRSPCSRPKPIRKLQNSRAGLDRSRSLKRTR